MSFRTISEVGEKQQTTTSPLGAESVANRDPEAENAFELGWDYLHRESPSRRPTKVELAVHFVQAQVPHGIL